MRPAFGVVFLFPLIVGACGTPPTPVEQAALLSEKGQDREAVALLEAHIRKHPEAIAERRLLIRLFAVTGDLGRAENAAADLAAHLPKESPVPWLELGHAMELVHRYDEALALYDRAAAVATKDPAGPKTGGLRAARWGETELAAPRLEEALRRDSRDAETWHALGLVRLHDGDLNGARLAYESGLVADPGALENRIGLATVALKGGDPAGALAQYDRILALRPQFTGGYLGRAWSLIVLGRLDEARAALDEGRRRGADTRAIDRQSRLIDSLRARHSAPR
jgi:tetratricopeptide (TPR) repeat protein